MGENKNIGMTSYSLKIIALAFMLLDHVRFYFNVGPPWLVLTTRFVAPLFLFFLVEGFLYTKDRKKYVLRLAAVAVAVFIVNVTINLILGIPEHFRDYPYITILMGANIFQTWTLFMVILILLEQLKKVKIGLKILYLVLIAAISYYSFNFSEGAFALLPLLLIFYYGHGKKKLIGTGVALWSAVFFGAAIYAYFYFDLKLSFVETLYLAPEWAMIFTILPIMLYNGQRGKNTPFAKWLFYIVYPVHIWLFMIVSHFVLT